MFNLPRAMCMDGALTEKIMPVVDDNDKRGAPGILVDPGAHYVCDSCGAAARAHGIDRSCLKCHAKPVRFVMDEGAWWQDAD